MLERHRRKNFDDKLDYTSSTTASSTSDPKRPYYRRKVSTLLSMQKKICSQFLKTLYTDEEQVKFFEWEMRVSDPYSCNLDCGTISKPCIKFFDIVVRYCRSGSCVTEETNVRTSVSKFWFKWNSFMTLTCCKCSVATRS